ncbi:hypothetical protein ANCDUO_27271, partial [Ancylostoma duodenale]
TYFCCTPSLRRTMAWPDMRCLSTVEPLKQLTGRTCTRCSTFTSRKRRSCMVFLILGRSMSMPFKYFQKMLQG